MGNAPIYIFFVHFLPTKFQQTDYYHRSITIIHKQQGNQICQWQQFCNTFSAEFRNHLHTLEKEKK